MANVVKLKPKFSSARQRLHLTNDVLRSLHLAPGQRVYDRALPGFYAQAGKRGISFRVMADVPSKVRRALGLPKTLERTVGRWPEISAGKARSEAQSMIGQIKQGRDPNEPEQLIEGPTLSVAFERFATALVKKIAAGDRQPATLAYYKESLARLDKKLTRLPLAALGARRDLVVDAHKDITRRNGAAAADHTIVALRSVYNHALRTWQDLPANPCIAVDFNGIRSRSDSGMGLGDLPAWWAEVSKIRNPVKQQLLLFMLLTGLRSADARTARHDDLDIQGKLLHVPKPKGGPRRAFDLPLSDPALDCIAKAKSAWAEAGYPPSDYLFPSAHNDKGYFATPRVERYVNGLRDRSLATGHALRHSFATICEACGHTEATYGPLLNHKAMSVTAKYANRAKNVDLYRAVAERVAKAIMRAIQQ